MDEISNGAREGELSQHQRRAGGRFPSNGSRSGSGNNGDDTGKKKSNSCHFPPLRPPPLPPACPSSCAPGPPPPSKRTQTHTHTCAPGDGLEQTVQVLSSTAGSRLQLGLLQGVIGRKPLPLRSPCQRVVVVQRGVLSRIDFAAEGLQL